MEWWIEQANGDRQSVHRLEHGLEVDGLGRFELGQGGLLAGGVVAEDEPAHRRQPIGGQEHVLGSAQSDALCAEPAANGCIALGVGVGANLHVAGGDGVGPGQQRVQFGWRRGAGSRQRTGIDTAGAAVDRDLVAGPHHEVADRDLVTFDVDVGGTDDGRDPPAVCHDCCVADHAATRGEDAA